MTQAQINKLHSISPVLNFYESISGNLVIDTTYGTSRYTRLIIGPRGGHQDTKTVYRDYDFQDKQPIGKLFTTNI